MQTTYLEDLRITTITNDELEEQDGGSPDDDGTDRHLHLDSYSGWFDAVVFGGREAARELIRSLEAAVANDELWR